MIKIKNEFDYITKKLKSCIGGGNISSMYLAITPFRKKEIIQVVVTLEMLKRFDIKDIEKADKLYETIQRFNYDLKQVVLGDKKRT